MYFRYALSANPSTDTQIHGSNVGPGVDTGSTVGRDLTTDATSGSIHSGTRNEDSKDEDNRNSGEETTKHSDVIQESQRSYDIPSEGSGISELRSTTENPYGGGLYGKEEISSPKHAGRASDFQSAEGLASDMPRHKYVRTSSSGDRGLDITGQSYIQ